MTELNNGTLTSLGPNVTVPAYDRRKLRVGVVHVGVGNFFRTHGAMYLERCLHLPGHEGWAMCGVGLSDGEAARAKAAAFRAQDGLYTLTEAAPDGSAARQVVGALIEYLHAPGDPEGVLTRLADPDTRIVTLTITEGGYNLDEGTGTFNLGNPDVASDLRGGPPRTVFGFLVEALGRRRRAGVPAFTVVSCDNLRGNGDTTRRAVLGYAGARDPDLAAWVEANTVFPNSMVDRVAPQVTPEVQRRLNEGTGVADLLPVVGESFTQWVLEDRFGPGGRPDLSAVGVELRNDVAAFEGIKGRLLNASHMLLSYPALLSGYRFVHEAMEDGTMRGWLEEFMREDVMPRLEAPTGVSLEDYKDSVLERFSNAAVGDQLLRIAHDGASKIPIFHTQTLRTLLEEGHDLRREAFFLACFGRYFAGTDDRGGRFSVVEPNLTASEQAEVAREPFAVLSIPTLRPLRLADDPRFAAAFRDALITMAEDGAQAALRDLLGSS